MARPLPVAVLISGGGTTLLNLVERIAAGRLDARIVQVICSRVDAAGIQRAKDAGLSVEAIPRKAFYSIEEFSERTFAVCREAGAELVCLAGYLQLLRIPDDYRGRVVNIHPALLPAFGGKGMFGHHVHEAVLEYGAKFSGCTVHYVDDQYDHGPIIAQRVVPVENDDTTESLAARVFRAECAVYPEVIQAIADDRLSLYGRQVRWRPT